MAVLLFLGLSLTLLSSCAATSHSAATNTGNGLRYLALGDSYTIGRSVPVAGRWPLQLAAALRARGRPVAPPRILARSGWTSQDLLSAMGNGPTTEQFDLVSVLIGVNNQFQNDSIETYRRDLREIFRRAIALSKRGRHAVFVLSIPDYGATPYGAADAGTIGRAIDRWNRVYRDVAGEYRLKFFDITGISRRGAEDPTLVSFDRLHPSAAQYRLWVDAIAAKVAALLDD